MVARQDDSVIIDVAAENDIPLLQPVEITLITFTIG